MARGHRLAAKAAGIGQIDDILDASLDAALRLDVDGTIMGWNAAAEALFGWTAREVIGHSIFGLILPPRVNPRDNPLAWLLATGSGPLAEGPASGDFLHSSNKTLRLEASAGHHGFSSSGTLTVFLREPRARAEVELEQALIIDELNHRMRNLLGIVSSIARQTANAADGLDDFLPAFQGRLVSLDHAYRILTAAPGDRGSLRQLLDVLLAVRQDLPGCSVVLDGPEVLLARRQFISMNMILHELVTNAIKYGALSQAGGRLEVRWTLTGHGKSGECRSLELDWRETVAGPVAPPTREGFGSRVIEASARQGLHGTCTRHWRENGLAFQLKFVLL